MLNSKALLRNCVWFAFMLPVGMLSSRDSTRSGCAVQRQLEAAGCECAGTFGEAGAACGSLQTAGTGHRQARRAIGRFGPAQGRASAAGDRAKAREQDINIRFESIIKLLEDERLSAATTNQTELQKELEALLSLLLKADRDTALASERERVRAYLKELNRLMRLERDLRARTESGDDAKRLTEAQQRVAEETGKLGEQITENESEESADAKAGSRAGEKKPTADKSDAAESKDAKSNDVKSGDGKSDKSSDQDSKDLKAADGKAAKNSSGKSEGQPSGKNSKQSPGGSDGQSSDSKSGETPTRSLSHRSVPPIARPNNCANRNSKWKRPSRSLKRLPGKALPNNSKRRSNRWKLPRPNWNACFANCAKRKWSAPSHS